MSKVNDLVTRLFSCPCGRSGWKEFEEVCLDILCYLFVPPLVKPKVQPRTYSGIDRRDAAFPNRNFDGQNTWGHLLKEFNARLIIVEFKNYKDCEIGKEEVDQLRNYMTEPMGRLALMICSKLPNEAAHIRRNTIYSKEKKVILFITKAQLKEMLYIKERGEDPADLIIDLVEYFYLQYE